MQCMRNNDQEAYKNMLLEMQKGLGLGVWLRVKEKNIRSVKTM